MKSSKSTVSIMLIVSFLLSTLFVIGGCSLQETETSKEGKEPFISEEKEESFLFPARD